VNGVTSDIDPYQQGTSIAPGLYSMKSIKDRLLGEDRSLLLYTLLTFGITWGVWIPLVLFKMEHPLFVLGGFGPTLAALILTGIQRGREGLSTLVRKLTIWRVHIGWYSFSLFAAVPVILVGIWLDVWLGGPVPEFNDLSQLYLVIPAFFYVLFASVLGEEIGWRRYALPRLLRSIPALYAGLILGAVWGVWPLPLFFMVDNFHSSLPRLPFLVQVFTFSILYPWMYIHTKGSLLLPHLFHASSNTALGVLPILPMDSGGRVRPMWLALSLGCLFTGIVVFMSGKDLRKGETWV
jgi:membrane protease YdiL (CAAX protease family)